MVLISDGRGNISLFGEEPLIEAQRVAEQLGADGVHMLVIDSRVTTPPGRCPVSGPQPAAALRRLRIQCCRDLRTVPGANISASTSVQGAIVEGVEKTLRGRMTQ